MKLPELQHVAMKFGHVTCHMEYMGSVLKAMYEAWDDLLFNLDNQLASYSKVRGQHMYMLQKIMVKMSSKINAKNFQWSPLTFDLCCAAAPP